MAPRLPRVGIHSSWCGLVARRGRCDLDHSRSGRSRSQDRRYGSTHAPLATEISEQSALTAARLSVVVLKRIGSWVVKPSGSRFHISDENSEHCPCRAAAGTPRMTLAMHTRVRHRDGQPLAPIFRLFSATPRTGIDVKWIYNDPPTYWPTNGHQ